jgi:hypothetical protein
MIKKVGPCFEDQLLRRVIPFTPEQRAGIFKELRETYLDHGVPFEKGVRALGNRLGWHPEAIIQAIAGPKTALNVRRFNAGVWKREAVRRGAVVNARSLVAHANVSRAVKIIDTLWNTQRGVSVTGHYGVFPGTHLKESLFIPTEWPHFFKAYWGALKLSKLEYSALHEYMRFSMENHRSYGNALKAGVDVTVGESFFGHGPKFKIGRWELGGRSGAAFDFIKRARLEIFDRWARDFPQMMSARERLEQQKIIAKFINHATGSIQVGKAGPWLGRLLFAPKLKPAQLSVAYVDPFRAAGFGVKRLAGKASPGEIRAQQFVFRRMGQLAAMQTAMLGANWVAGQILGEDWAPNLDDPNRADWLRLRMGGHSIITSPTVEWLKFPVRLLYHVANGHDVAATIGKDVLQQFLYQSNPMIGNVWNVLFGEDPVTHRRTPYPGLVTTAGRKTEEPYGWPEYLSQKLMIPLSAGFHEMHESMKQEGLDHPTMMSWLHFVGGALFAQSGYHASVVHKKEETTGGPSGPPRPPHPPRPPRPPGL